MWPSVIAVAEYFCYFIGGSRILSSLNAEMYCDFVINIDCLWVEFGGSFGESSLRIESMLLGIAQIFAVANA